MLFLIILVIVVLVVGFFAFHYYSESQAQWKSLQRGIPYASIPSQMWTVFRKKRFDLIESELVQKHGPVFGGIHLSKYVINVADPEMVQIIFNREFTKFPNRRQFENTDPLFNNMVFVTNDEKWRRIRSVMSPAFSSGKLKLVKPMIDQSTRTMVKNFDRLMRENENVNVKEVFGAFVMESIIGTSYGLKVDVLAEPHNPILVNVKKMFSNDQSLRDIGRFAIIFIAPKIASMLDIRLSREVMDYFNQMSLQVIDKKREQMKGQPTGKAMTLIELFLEAEQEAQSQNGIANAEAKKKFLTNVEMVSQCIMFFTGGYDTTSAMIIMAAYYLALNPEMQDRLYEEITEEMDKLRRETDNPPDDPYELVTFDSLVRFKYLGAVLDESLRMVPPGTTVDRLVAEDVQLETSDGKIRCHFRKGDIVRVPIYAMHHNPANFSEPHLFRPDRFLGEPTYHKGAYQPFGSGPRNCLAKSLALFEGKLALLHAVRVFKFSVGSKTKIPPEFFSQPDLLTPKDTYLKMEKRV